MVQLLHGDCLTLIKEVPLGSVDLVLCDPPYSSGGTHAGDRKASTTAKYTDSGHDGAAKLPAFSGDNMDQRSFTRFMRWVCTELRLRTREGGILEMFVDWRNLPAMTDAVQMAGWVWRGVVVWDKGASRNLPGRFRNDCEFVVWCSNGDMPINWKTAKGTRAMPGVYHAPSVAPKKRFHQTEKPLELLDGLLAICPPGGTVLDAFMGSGSTGVTAVRTGRSFIGMELSDQYFEIASSRIQEEKLHIQRRVLGRCTDPISQS